MGKSIRVGLVVNTQGIKGEVRVYPLTDYKERFEELEYVFIENNDKLRLNIERVRYKKELAILKFKDFDNINDVEKFKDKYLVIDESQVRELPEDTYYITDLVDSKVYNYEDGSYIGNLVDVIQNTAQDTYVVKYQGSKKEQKKNILIPAVKEFIKEVNIKEKTIKVKLIEGMIE
ncbi:MAG: rRNA processing protein RimM [Candidatus Petromonas sp.]|nr:rRNA processing protein RimM [Candidatus Petromonas sp.]